MYAFSNADALLFALIVAGMYTTGGVVQDLAEQFGQALAEHVYQPGEAV